MHFAQIVYPFPIDYAERQSGDSENAKTPQTESLRGFEHQNKEGCLISRTFSCSYGQLQTSAYASGWG